MVGVKRTKTNIRLHFNNLQQSGWNLRLKFVQTRGLQNNPTIKPWSRPKWPEIWTAKIFSVSMIGPRKAIKFRYRPLAGPLSMAATSLPILQYYSMECFSISVDAKNGITKYFLEYHHQASPYFSCKGILTTDPKSVDVVLQLVLHPLLPGGNRVMSGSPLARTRRHIDKTPNNASSSPEWGGDMLTS